MALLYVHDDKLLVACSWHEEEEHLEAMMLRRAKFNSTSAALIVAHQKPSKISRALCPDTNLLRIS